MRFSSDGQAAMVDAILFMTVMLVASAVIISSVGHGASENSELSGLRQYAVDYSQTLLAMELSGLRYTDADGSSVDLGKSGRSIGQLLCDEAVILGGRAGICDFSDYESRILAAGKSLIRPGLDFAISCNGDTVFISETVNGVSELPPTRSASGMTVLSGGTARTAVTVTVYVWVL